MLGGVESQDAPSRRVCSAADALSVVGDRYSLLIVREIGFGYRRFQDIAGFTGAPRDVLSARLRKLEKMGVLERRLYSEHPPRYEYHLTEKGIQLRPALLALKEWGDRYLHPGDPPVVVAHTCGAEFLPVTICEGCKQPVAPGELVVTGGTDPPNVGAW
jgi:DNA-binding HxlR family transcriptional regulator